MGTVTAGPRSPSQLEVTPAFKNYKASHGAVTRQNRCRCRAPVALLTALFPNSCCLFVPPRARPKGRSESAGREPGDAQAVTIHRPILNPRDWHGWGKKTKLCPPSPELPQGQRRRMYRMGSGSAAESARRPASRERQGQRRRIYRMGSGSAAESARRPASRERQGQRPRATDVPLAVPDGDSSLNHGWQVANLTATSSGL